MAIGSCQGAASQRIVRARLLGIWARRDSLDFLIRLLMICTANICRSPTAAGLLALRAGRTSSLIEVDSGGLLPGGRLVPAQVVAAVAPFGVDLSDHVSSQITVERIARADVVVTMTRQHLREVVLQLPDAWSRTFTLDELVRRGENLGPRLADRLMAEWFQELHLGRQRQDMIGTSREGDIADPYGGPDAGYRRMAVTLADLVDRLAAMLWPTDSSGS
jgi:protein-tyrosine phosphatase